MKQQGVYYRSLVTIVILLSMILLVGGCSHRSTHATGHGQKVKKSNMSDENSGRLSSLDEWSRGSSAGDGLDGFGSGDKPQNQFSPLNELFSQDSLEEEDADIKPLSPADLARQYWNQRRQAELLSDRSGLNDVFFELDSWELTDEAKQALMNNAEILRSNPTNAVTIEGHCDERGTRAYNYILGKKRALRVQKYLTSLGVSSSQLTIMTYGKDNPLCRGGSESCFQQNRRAHFLLGVKVADARPWNTDRNEWID
ncbi:MAG: hypothetical protein NPIRA04_20780 [Nitrospirales bacterium]|nr:MAG: hypothetical protein NPIRA04_20780 [Nitrospirales bacterium]